jgi:hypothetical protein
MDTSIQLALSISVPTLAVLVGILVNNSPLSDLRVQMSELRAHMDQRFDDTKETLRAEMRRIEEVLDARLKHLEEDRH